LARVALASAAVALPSGSSRVRDETAGSETRDAAGPAFAASPVDVAVLPAGRARWRLGADDDASIFPWVFRALADLPRVAAESILIDAGGGPAVRSRQTKRFGPTHDPAIAGGGG